MKNPNLLKGLLEHFTQEVVIYQKARKLATNEEKSSKSKGFGITSIIFSILAIIGAIGLPYVSYLMLVAALKTNLAIIGNIVLICLAITILVIPIFLARYGIILSRAQRIINKLKIGSVSRYLGWISFILSVGLVIVLTVYILGTKQIV